MFKRLRGNNLNRCGFKQFQLKSLRQFLGLETQSLKIIEANELISNFERSV